MRKEKIIKWIIYITGIACLYIFLASRFLTLMNFILTEKMDLELLEFTKYGDLYYNNCINYYKEDMPVQMRRFRLSEKNSSVNDADILTYGDSFFDVSFQTTLPERISDTTDTKVFCYMTQDPTQANPFSILNEKGFTKRVIPKVIIVESVERNIPTKFSKPYEIECSDSIKPNNFYDRLMNNYIFKSSDEQLFDLMLKRSYLTSYIYATISTLKFDLFGDISSHTPVYRVEPSPWLFYSKSLDSVPGGFYYKHNQGEISNYADNIALLANNLKSVYNLEMIFMAVPNKYSLYNKFVNNDEYNNFIPILQNELEKRNVHYIDLYSKFASSKENLYYGTDTHWNKKGVDLALKLTLAAIDSVNTE